MAQKFAFGGAPSGLWVRRKSRGAWAALAVLASALPLAAEVTLPPIFSDHMVLLRDKSTAVWGKADAGEAVTVTVAGQTATAKADPQGRWKVALDLEKAPQGPHELRASAKSGEAKAGDVLVGEVWLASGQSNMEFKLRRADGVEAETALPVNSKFRYFSAAHVGVPVPADQVPGKWIVDAPETRLDFSAAAYFFAKTVQQALDQSIGVIDTSWGGSACEAWISQAAIEADPGVFPGAKKVWQQADGYKLNKAKFRTDFPAWLQSNGRDDSAPADPAAYAGETVSTADWAPVTAPGVIKGNGIAENGVVWVRAEVNIDPAFAGKNISCELGLVHDATAVYWNGVKVHEVTYADYPGVGSRDFAILKGNLVKPGRNVMALRLFAPLELPRIDNRPPTLKFSNSPALPIQSWFAKTERPLPALEASGRASAPALLVGPPESNHTASYIYNGVIHPLLGLGIRGVIWYQGETNSGRSYQYRTTFANMISDWRANWKRGDFPFYFCQLPCFGDKKNAPGESGWAELRESQLLTLGLPNTGMAVLIDLGEANDIHPHAKRPVGERLAALALGKTYGKPAVPPGPVYGSAAVEGGSIRVHFKPGSGSLAALPLPERYILQTAMNKTAPLVRNSPQSQLEGFALCGEDGKWQWAGARIDGATVVVSSASVPQPKYVRYAWGDNPTCNLGNSAGIPASPFRSDSFKETSRDKTY